MESEIEESCDLQLEGADSLDWSVSGISGALDPDRFHSEISSNGASAFASPEKTQVEANDLQKLAGQFKSIQVNLQHISEKSVTPVNSPRPKSAPEQRDSSRGVNVTPPVKDTGLGVNGSAARMSRIPLPIESVSKKLDFKSNDSRFDQVRSVLKDLEGSAKQIKLGESKIPKPKPNQSSFLEKEFQEMNDFLEQVKNSSSEAIAKRLSENVENTTVVEQIKQPEQVKRLETTISELKSKIRSLEAHISSLEASNEQKQSMLNDLKARWSETLQTWSKDQQELVEKLKNSRSEADQLKLENASAKEQFVVCQDELAKAVQIASDFKQKLSEEESLKQDMLNQLLSERTSKSKQLLMEQAKLQAIKDEFQKLSEEASKLRSDNSAIINSNSDLSKKLHDQGLSFDKERTHFEEQITSLKSEVELLMKERTTTESSLHTFYASQMESILSEKIGTLQENVQIWEKNLLRDKQEALTLLQNQHDVQIQNLRKTLFDDVTKRYEDQVRDMSLSLAASRKEADALREQLKLQKPSNHTTLLTDHGNVPDSPRSRQERMWREILANSAATRRPSMILNNLQDFRVNQTPER